MSEVELITDKPIAAYDEFRSQLAELKKTNANAVFDYEDAQGNKDARSHVYKLRKTKTAIDKVRKEQKQTSLDYGRKVDSEAKEIIGEVESMIDVHEKPLKAIEQKEKDRKAAIEEKYDLIVGARGVNLQGASIGLIEGHILDLKHLEPDDSMDEYMAEATREYKISMQHLLDLLEAAKNAKAENEELERLRAESAERDRKDREEKIAEDARLEAEQKAAENEKRIEREKQEAIEREETAKRDLAEATKRHEEEQKQAVIDAEQRVKREVKEAEELEQREAQKREANKKHKASVNNEAMECLISAGIPKTTAKKVITLIAKKEIDHVSIAY